MAADRGSGGVAGSGNGDEGFYRRLYDDKAEYVARREDSSLEARLIRMEVAQFKVPNLVAVLPHGLRYGCVVEIGCATGELLSAFPGPPGTRRIGFDISPENVCCAARRFPQVEFHNADFRACTTRADIVILSDVLEHVPDDRAMLRDAARLGRIVLINLPLEDNWLNATRAYGPDDVSGHLRRYSLADGLALIRSAGLRVTDWRQVWVHESECEASRRRMLREALGSPYRGGRLAVAVKHGVTTLSNLIQPIGRRLFASNLFACATLDPPA